MEKSSGSDLSRASSFVSLSLRGSDQSLVIGIVTFALLDRYPSTRPPHPTLKNFAQFCGLSGTLLAVCQYAPQIYRTYSTKLVGALSLGTMAIQVPGSVLFVISIFVSPDTDWTSWLPYAVTGAMQAALLVSISSFQLTQVHLPPLEEAPGKARHRRLRPASQGHQRQWQWPRRRNDKTFDRITIVRWLRM